MQTDVCIFCDLRNQVSLAAIIKVTQLYNGGNSLPVSLLSQQIEMCCGKAWFSLHRKQFIKKRPFTGRILNLLLTKRAI